MATFYGFIAIVMWGTLALLGVMTKEIPAFQLLFLCFCVSTIIMFIKQFVQYQRLFIKPSLTAAQWLFGTMSLFGFHACYFFALKLAPAIEVSLIVYAWPLLLALFVANKQTRLYALLGGSLGFIGISTIITGGKELTINNAHFYGYLLALICALIWSTYSWFISKNSSKVDDIGWLSFVVAICALLVHWQIEPSHWNFSLSQWAGIVLLGLGPVGGAFYLWDIGLKQGNKSLLASLSFSAPLISSVILAMVGLNQWSFNIASALFLILLGAVIVNKKPKTIRS